MRRLIAAAVGRARTVLLIFLALLVLGVSAYSTLPREAAPEVEVPIFFVSVFYQGITPEDAERLMLRPLERELQSVEGLDELYSWGGEGFALVRLDFDPGYDAREALSDVREQVDQAEPDLPPGAETPIVEEVDLSLFPVLTIHLSGPVAERSLIAIARDLRDRTEARPGVLEAEIQGDREDVLEVQVDPLALESYELSYGEVIGAIDRNNQLVAAGAMDTGAGRIAIKVPGTVEDVDDIRDTVVRAADGAIVRVADVAEVRQTYRDPDSFSRIDGHPALSLEVRKRTDANILAVAREAREVIAEAESLWPESVEVTYTQDMADDVADLLGDLENNVITAILLVVLVIVGTLGGRASLLVGLAIPGAFLTGLLVIQLLGYTLNIVVLFALILVVGMLVDGAVVVTELADRYIAEGRGRKDAFRAAAQRMAWPITSAIATTVAVFFPMLFWPGYVGEFVAYLPATVIITLLASLAMALIFIPTLGSVLGPRSVTSADQVAQIRAAEAGDFARLGGVTGGYVRMLRPLLRYPARTLLGTVLITGGVFGIYGIKGHGVDFFPDIEPKFVQVQVQARGDLSVWEADALVRQVEAELRGEPEIKTVHARTIGTQQARLAGDHAEDVIGVLQLQLTDWRLRAPAEEIVARLREIAAGIPGVVLQFREQERGISDEKPVQIHVSGAEGSTLQAAVADLRSIMDEVGGFTDVEDDRPLPGIELEVAFDREEAARFGVDVGLLGRGVQTLTDGVLLGTYRPDYTDEEVDIRLRIPAEQRHLQRLANLRLPTEQGLVPLVNFGAVTPVPATGLITKRNAERAYTVEADVAGGELVANRLEALRTALHEDGLDQRVDLRFAGESEDQAEAAAFLMRAFVLALLAIVAILLTQFNRIDHTLLVLSAIVFSTAGVLMALLIRGEPFGIVMSGIGVLALAGIVVNNNIVLIDTFGQLRREGVAPLDAALRTAAQRLRPVVLTAVTTVLGLLPMVLAWTVDFVGRDFHIGAPSTDYWVQLATAIAGGLLLATPLTLLFTPAMLVWAERRRE